MLLLGLILIVTVGYYISILAKGPEPVHICEYVEGSGNQYVCTYNNPIFLVPVRATTRLMT